MTNKRFFLIGVVFLVSLIGAVGLFAQQTTDSGILSLQGVVLENVEINVTTLPAASALDLDNATAQRVQVASVEEVSNVYAGYTVTILSAHWDGTDASLDGSAGNPDEVAYTLEYGTANFVTLDGSDPATDVTNGGKTAGTSYDIYINFTGIADIYADTYSDTLTFNINAK